MRRTPNMNKLAKKDQARLESWKKKAIQRREMLNVQKKAIKSLRQSRGKWKQKYKAELGLRLQQQKQLAKYKELGYGGHKVRHHSYKSLIILLAIRMRCLGMISLRSCRQLLIIWQSMLELETGVPCINTIRNWEHKVGYYRLNQRGQKEEEYAIIVDESFCIGKQTLLLVLGVNLSVYQCKQSIDFESIQVLGLGPRPYWKGEEIAQFLEGLKQRQYRISYGVSDGGNNLIKAFKIKQIPRIEDCTHTFSKLIERHYKDDPVFKAFCKRYSLLNRQCCRSSFAVICPPKLRGDSRFLNLYPIADWADKNLKLLKDLKAKEPMNQWEEQAYAKLEWLKQYQPLIEPLVALSRVMKACFKLLKQQGLSLASQLEIEKILDEEQLPAFFDQGVRQYLQRNLAVLTQYDQVVCCSDIIESFFGKYKNQQKFNPATGITPSCLRIANYGKSIDEAAIIKILEQVKVVDLLDWQQMNLLETLSAKKKKLYKKCG